MGNSEPIASFLITAAGTGTGWAYAMTLAQQFPDIRLVTADTNPRQWVSAGIFASEHIQMPGFSADSGYLEELNRVLEQYAISYYLPIIDPEIDFAARNSHSIPARVIAPNEGFTALALAKDNYEAILGAIGIDTPRRISVSDLLTNGRAYAKGPGGFGGRATRFVTKIDDLDSIPSGYFIQEVIDGPEFTVDCFPTADSDVVFTSVRERIETKSGVCTKARIKPHPMAEHYARILTREFALVDPFCFQVIGDSRSAVIDINPRLGAGTMMSVANGSDFYGAHIARILGRPWSTKLRRNMEHCAVTRQYTEFVSRDC